MYAIVDIAGKQTRVAPAQHVLTPRLQAEAGSKVEFEKVLMIDEDGKTKWGSPTIKKAKVVATVIEHGKGDKVIVFKKKRRKGYKVKNGHRQDYTKVLIESIS